MFTLLSKKNMTEENFNLGNIKPNSFLLGIKQVFIPDSIACEAKDQMS